MKDRIVKQVLKQYKERSRVGLTKYGTTLADNNTDDFLQHLKEELMDAVLYIEKLQDDIKKFDDMHIFSKMISVIE